jgi:hypothetical protein
VKKHVSKRGDSEKTAAWPVMAGWPVTWLFVDVMTVFAFVIFDDSDRCY